MAKLVKRSQQILSLEETINKINGRLNELANRIQELAKFKEQNQINEDEFNKEISKIRAKYDNLKEQKEKVSKELKKFRDVEKRRQEMGKHGQMSFYNIVLAYKIPRLEGVPFYIKVYEIVSSFAMKPGFESVSNYVIVMSNSISSADQENYFASEKPVQKLNNVHNYIETSSTGVAKEFGLFIENYARPQKIAVQSIELAKTYKAFDNVELKTIIDEINSELSNLSNKYEDLMKPPTTTTPTEKNKPIT